MSPFFTAFFFWAGTVFVGAIVLGIIYLIFIALVWPFVEACSLTRCTVKALGKGRHSSIRLIWWSAYKDCVGGRNWECVRTNLFTWNGVGNYTIHKEGDDNE